MAEYRLSKRADGDIAEIASHTIENFGFEQARRYRDELERRFHYLAKHPTRGRKADNLAPGLRRFTFESHVIFYLPKEWGVLIVRVLHQRMDIENHLMSED